MGELKVAPPMEILYLSHCVPYPPDKGERIRAYHQVRHLARRHRVHVVCAARHAPEAEHLEALRGWCASVKVCPAGGLGALLRGGFRFALGGSLNTGYYAARSLRNAVAAVCGRHRPAACFVYTAVMFQFAPPDLPRYLDLVDVDSEKWFQYARTRSLALLYGAEARRLRAIERDLGKAAARVWLTTRQEAELYRSFAPEARTGVIENGIDAVYFDPGATAASTEPAAGPYAVFVGQLDYYPNSDAAVWFAREVLPLLRGRFPEVGFRIVGRNPPASVRALDRLPGVRVTGAVPDVRPYLKHAAAFVAPLRIARVIQNKVLEALAMGCPVLASDAVAATFGDRLPVGLFHCPAPADYRDRWDARDAVAPAEIRDAIRRRFNWEKNLAVLDEALSPG